MNPRSNEGLMDWDYDGEVPVDLSSPFTAFARNHPAKRFDTSSSSFGLYKPSPNPFAAPPSPSKQSHALPPKSSTFTPQIPSQYAAAPFRNPAFTTPRKFDTQDDSILSEASPVEHSPALTDVSEIPADTPEPERKDDAYTATITPSRLSRALFGKTSPGKGQIARGLSFQQDKIRKRRRAHGDRDVGSVRSRRVGRLDDSDSELDGRPDDTTSSHARQASSTGYVRNFMGLMSEYPSLPFILSYYLHLIVNLAVVSAVLWAGWSLISMVRSDMMAATERERNKLLSDMEVCMHHFTKNKCSPVSHRVPAMEALCNEWELCMNQDPTSVMKVQVSVKNLAEILNEFASTISWKAASFILVLVLLVLVANNIGLGKARPDYDRPHAAQPSVPASSHRAVDDHQHLLPGGRRDLHQAYIIAPLKDTPRHIRKAFLVDDQTDTDASPDQRSIMPPPRTPSHRQSPIRLDRTGSPGKRNRSPDKGYC